jgi:hypothetical protein
VPLGAPRLSPGAFSLVAALSWSLSAMIVIDKRRQAGRGGRRDRTDGVFVAPHALDFALFRRVAFLSFLIRLPARVFKANLRVALNRLCYR